MRLMLPLMLPLITQNLEIQGLGLPDTSFDATSDHWNTWNPELGLPDATSDATLKTGRPEIQNLGLPEATSDYRPS